MVDLEKENQIKYELQSNSLIFLKKKFDLKDKSKDQFQFCFEKSLQSTDDLIFNETFVNGFIGELKTLIGDNGNEKQITHFTDNSILFNENLADQFIITITVKCWNRFGTREEIKSRINNCIHKINDKLLILTYGFFSLDRSKELVDSVVQLTHEYLKRPQLS